MIDLLVKRFRLLVLSAALLLAYKTIAIACPSQDLTNARKVDIPKYTLTIVEDKIPLLKDTIFNREKCLITYVPVTLTNYTKDTLRYMAMSASWWDLYTLDNKNYALAEDYWNVFKNGPQVLVLPPYQSTTRNFPVITYKSYFRPQKIRIGMSLQRVGFELPDFLYPSQPMPKTTNLIWSNAVTVN